MANLVPVNNNQLSKKINPDSFFGKKAKVGTTRVKNKGTTLRSEFVLIRKKVIKIDKLLNIFIKLEKKNQESNRRKGELSAREKSESKLEKKKKKETGLGIPSIPVGGNFLESIKRFLFFTFLNIALPKLLELLPKLRELGKAIAPVTNFLLNIVGGIGKGLLSGFVNFIDWGYKIRDNTEKTIKQIGGDKAAKDFNEFNKRLNTFIDLSILAGLTALDIGLDAQKYRKKQLEDQKKRGGAKPRVTEGRGGQKPIGRPKVTTGKGGKAGTGTVTQGRGGKPLGKFSKFKTGPFAKFAGPIGKFLGAATPFLGAGIGAADAAARFSSGDKVGGALASASAALDAFAGVAALTGIGLPLAAIATPISIAIDVVLLLRDLVKVMFPAIPMFRNGGRIKLFAQGGRVGSSGRTIKAQRKTFGAKSFKQEVKPGKDIGGKQQILKLFPDPSPENKQQTISASPWWERWLGGKNQTTPTSGKPANPYRALKTTAEILSKIPGPFGKLMSAGASIPLGQKPDRDIGKGFGSFIGQITQDIIDNNVNLSFGNIMKSISGFADGGDIRNQNIMKNNDIGYQVGQVVEKAIGSLISSKVNEAVTSIQKEIASIGKPPEGDGGGGGGSSAGGEDVFHGMGAERMWNFFKNKGLSDFAVAGIMGNARWESSFNPTARGKGMGPGGSDAIGIFQWGETERWKDLVKWATSQNLNPWDYDTQLKFAWHEMQTSEKATIPAIQGATSAADAAEKFRAVYERSKQTEQRRKDAAEDFYRQYKGKMYIPPSLPTTGVPLTETSQYGWRWGREHHGIDLQAKSGWRDTIHLPVVSKQGGVVQSAGITKGNFGIVEIRHDDGSLTRYVHLNGFKVKRGDTVRSGQVIGRIAGEGDPGYGNSTGPHLHFEYYPPGGNGPINPKNIYSRYVSLGATRTQPASIPLSSTPPSSSIAPVSGTKFKVGGTTIFKGTDGKYYSTEKDRNGKYLEVDKRGWEYAKKEGTLISSLNSQTPVSIAPLQNRQSFDVLAQNDLPENPENQSRFAIQPINRTLIQQA